MFWLKSSPLWILYTKYSDRLFYMICPVNNVLTLLWSENLWSQSSGVLLVLEIKKPIYNQENPHQPHRQDIRSITSEGIQTYSWPTGKLIYWLLLGHSGRGPWMSQHPLLRPCSGSEWCGRCCRPGQWWWSPCLWGSSLRFLWTTGSVVEG